jgi:hypothetical protein
MIPFSRGDLFRVVLPKVFIPKNIKEFYYPYVFRMPIMIKDISDLINYSIQSITVPTFNYDPVQQKLNPNKQTKHKPEWHLAKNANWRSSINSKDLPDNTFTITFSLLDGYINYWILLSTYLYYYGFENKQTHTCDIPVRIVDSEGNVMFSVLYKDVLFTGLSEYQISYSDLVQEFKTFDCTFTFNEMEMKFERG